MGAVKETREALSEMKVSNKDDMKKFRETYKNKKMVGEIYSYDDDKKEGKISYQDKQDEAMIDFKESAIKSGNPLKGKKASFKVDEKYEDGLAAKEVEVEKDSNEEFDISKGIQDLIDINFSKDKEARAKAAQLFKGLLLSKDPEALAFSRKLDKMLSGMKVED